MKLLAHLQLSRLLTFLALSLPLASCVGCSSVIYPQRQVIDPEAVYVADYGVHSGLMLPTDDGRFVEYVFGDWGFSALNHCGPQDVFGALLVSQGSAFGRKYYGHVPGGDVPNPTHPSPHKVVKVIVSHAQVVNLREQLEARYQRAAATVVHNPENDTDYVKDPAHYGLGNNCNHLTAQSLRQLGCDVRGTVFLSHFSVGTVRAPATSDSKAPVAAKVQSASAN